MKSMEYQWSHESVGPINKLKPYAEVTLQLIVVHIGAKKDEDACHKVVHFIFLCSDHIAKLPSLGYGDIDVLHSGDTQL
eukprot:XP_001709495.1 Hypothetical protein GL50803_38796 [Giardia lamblia ATCC 50803]